MSLRPTDNVVRMVDRRCMLLLLLLLLLLNQAAVCRQTRQTDRLGQNPHTPVTVTVKTPVNTMTTVPPTEHTPTFFQAGSASASPTSHASDLSSSLLLLFSGACRVRVACVPPYRSVFPHSHVPSSRGFGRAAGPGELEPKRK